MASRRKELTDKVEQTRRTPRPERLLDVPASRHGYKVISISLYTPEARWVDGIARILENGAPKKHRSLVIREGIRQLQRLLRSKSDAEVRRFFQERTFASDDQEDT